MKILLYSSIYSAILFFSNSFARPFIYPKFFLFVLALGGYFFTLKEKTQKISILLSGILLGFILKIYCFKDMDAWLICLFWITGYLLFSHLQFQGEEFKIQVAKVFVISGFLLSIWGLIQGMNSSFNRTSMFSFLGNVNYSSHFCVLCWPWIIKVFPKNSSLRTVIKASLFLFIILSGSRVSFCVLLLFIIIEGFSQNNRKQIIQIFFLVISGIMLFLFLYPQRVKNLYEGIDVNLLQRKRIILLTLDIIDKNLLWGGGTGSFYLNYQKSHAQGKQAFYSKPDDAWNAHNDLLEFTSEQGVAGLTLIIISAFLLLKNNKIQSEFQKTGVISLAGFLIISLFSFPCYRLEMILFFWLNASIVWNQKRIFLSYFSLPSKILGITLIGISLYWGMFSFTKKHIYDNLSHLKKQGKNYNQYMEKIHRFFPGVYKEISDFLVNSQVKQWEKYYPIEDHYFYYLKGKEFYLKGENKSAQAALEKSLSYSPGFLVSRYFLARVFQKNKETGKSVEQLEKIIILFPDFLPAYSLITDLLLEKEDRENLLKYCKQAILTFQLDSCRKIIQNSGLKGYQDREITEELLRFYTILKSVNALDKDVQKKSKELGLDGINDK